ncbi:hypothetical protein GV794_21855 [Nocardia cyriacigeorgica]|uniref:Uncharacterized protein n=1 Tax=Nocardia cyriacigeorgica TaxID=135487 RepID=A0A6P1DES6_9NOCA|nr:hypothetical protein [Nocardia cyriacigeorgica]NEW37845.1 hypothetical protein [Nocardia cyriacigeorgica]NEW47664.1 hypothetical protein [Nocardia cyriacigeorgica]NEW48770.1 hypothetical protein [Nocardia cyriacigeorgica]NEW58273.1 hypothetical protein [Nocardia cyriacigeorgica]
MATSATVRISRLRALIEHPNTGDGERATAQRMLDRILAKAGHEPVGDRTYGNRHHRVGRHADIDRIADMIRDDIVLARATFAPGATRPGEPALRDPLGDAPSQITYTVDTPHHSCIDVTIDNIPPDWGWVHEDGIDIISPALQELADELAEIMNGYNRDGSDIDKRFFGRVRIPHLTLVW